MSQNNEPSLIQTESLNSELTTATTAQQTVIQRSND